MTIGGTESVVEEATLAWFEGLGYDLVHGPDIAPGEPQQERAFHGDVVLAGRLRDALERLTPRSGDTALRTLTAPRQRPVSHWSLKEAKAKSILDLYQLKKDWIAEKTHSRYAVQALDWFFSRAIFKTSDFVASSSIPAPTANRILRIARDNGLLRELRTARGSRPAIVAFSDLLNIAEGRQLF